MDVPATCASSSRTSRLRSRAWVAEHPEDYAGLALLGELNVRIGLNGAARELLYRASLLKPPSWEAYQRTSLLLRRAEADLNNEVHSRSRCATPAVGAASSDGAQRADPRGVEQDSNSTSGGSGMTDLLGMVLVVSMIVFMAARTVPLITAKIEGELKLEVPLPLMFRLLDMRMNIMATLAVLILGSGLVGERWISHELFLFAVVAMSGIVLIPRRYRFTTRGVSPNRATFRAWSEFHAWQASGNVIRLEGAGRFSSFRLYVTGSDRDSVVKLVGRYVPRKADQPHAAVNGKGRFDQRFARTKGGTR